ncbi:MAG TPA: NADH-ubiquinone oxidoreductase-F iron-sulfur binding region domain-containing protein [Candidatus Krumholzibacteria bacterium]|nr:NADH-ubiquinone oxidoreductase-F iron-sulfur binding region domain-containing protein [Candidatus Krumholzibacteria bacterium]HPD73369.1 NADH-ubiquinone oxidoreductase-F iron-sulfur binding region domain-containing protein [Candidatus Krumholzibacteria bacterium]HRY42110.1 NADH-ubiquinone oxidoreductase-F iron-sulfur binding region domain-containing protein [Candidatus Krumholzibacteria bacterium]
MSTPESRASGCWSIDTPPSPQLLGIIAEGPWAKDLAGTTLEKRVVQLRREDVDRPTVFVGTGTCGLGAGAAKTVAAVKEYLAATGTAADLVEVGCVGICSEEPILDVQLPGRARISYAKADADKVPAILGAALAGRPLAEGCLGQLRTGRTAAWDDLPWLDQHPFLAPQVRVVLKSSGIIDPSSIDEYIAWGGYSSYSEILRNRTPEQVCDEVLASGLRGRGGGGFPTGRKWKMALAEKATQKYLICNADEGDPGAFMDRAVGESDPHRLIEGIAIAAFGIGATKAYIYIRAEYPLAVRRLEIAISQAKAYGLLGKNILGSGVDLEIIIKMGAGAFVCGEETALMHSIEGKRGMPRPRPPFPAKSGLFGKPTIINNVETLANLPAVFAIGAPAFAAMGTEGSKGTKVFALSGMVRRTGLVEIPMGTTLREIVMQIGGGTPGKKKTKAVQIGGPSGGCIPEPSMDVRTDYEELKKYGAIMGSGGLVVMDEGTCMVDLAKFFMEFIQSESCGKCIPCREGTKRMLEILDSMTHNRHSETEFDALRRFQGVMELERLANVIRDSSLCGLGQTAPNPVLATLRWYRDEYEAHVYERRCPAGACKDLVGAPCETGCPVGTEVWRYVAHVARGEYDNAYQIIRQANPFPSACARVCNHPCESLCRCGATGGDPIAIRTLKRFVVDRVDPASFKVDVKKATDRAKKVAVIGAGPAGLTAAHCLSVKGHRVTIFEKEKRPGGMLVCAIPEYRLPRQVLDREIKSLLNENTDLKVEHALGRDFTIDSLLAGGFDAVYLAMGSHQSKRLGVPGEDAQGILPGIEFLKAYNLHGKELGKGKVGIVGGGNSAIDAARVARRQKAVKHVTVFYRRTEAEMPAYREEIEAAREEGVEIVELVAPVAVIAKDGVVRGLRLQRNELGPPDDSGRRRPVPVPGSEYDVELDIVVAAISEEPSTAAVTGLTLTSWGSIRTNTESHITSRPGVFGGGDVVRGPNTVVDAVHDGKDAAEMIDRYLTGKNLKRIVRVKLPTVYLEPAAVPESDETPVRVKSPHLAVAERRQNFSEVELAINEAAARCEAQRCLRCDLEFTQP